MAYLDEKDEEKKYDYSKSVSDFDKNFKENQDYWASDREKAHERQTKNVAALDKVTGGVSRYDPTTGVWDLSDGRKSTEIGVTGNSYLSPYFDRTQTDGYKKRENARERYFSNTFSYDPEKDELYQAYKQKYILGAQKASDDAIARSALRTGGMAGSYATTAGALAYQDQMNALTDKIPELSQIAYQKWEDEQARLYRQAEAYNDDIEDEYSDWARGRSAYLENKENAQNAEALKKANEESENAAFIKYSVAMNKAQAEGFSALSDSEREAIYSMGAYYNPTTDEITGYDGQNYELGIRAKKDESDQNRIAAILFKANNAKTGASSLSVSELSELMDAGYSVSGGVIKSPAGESTYAPTAAQSSPKSTSASVSLSEDDENKTAEELREENGTINIGGVEFTNRGKGRRIAAELPTTSDDDIVSGIAIAWQEGGETEDEKLLCVDEYLETLPISEEKKTAALEKFIAMYS